MYIRAEPVGGSAESDRRCIESKKPKRGKAGQIDAFNGVSDRMTAVPALISGVVHHFILSDMPSQSDMQGDVIGRQTPYIVQNRM